MKVIDNSHIGETICFIDGNVLREGELRGVVNNSVFIKQAKDERLIETSISNVSTGEFEDIKKGYLVLDEENIESSLIVFLNSSGISRDDLISDFTIDDIVEDTYCIGVEKFGLFKRVIGGWVSHTGSVTTRNDDIFVTMQADDSYHGLRGTTIKVDYIVKGKENPYI